MIELQDFSGKWCQSVAQFSQCFCYSWLSYLRDVLVLACFLCHLCVCVGVCGAMNLQGHKVQLAYGGCILLSVNGLNY
jgi:hypothetical protein